MRLIVTDDAGFGAPSTFSGVLSTSALDRIPNMGLRYTQFHSTALCAPPRAAVITGGNPHGWLRRHLRTRDGLPRIRLDCREDQRDDWWCQREDRLPASRWWEGIVRS